MTELIGTPRAFREGLRELGHALVESPPTPGSIVADEASDRPDCPILPDEDETVDVSESDLIGEPPEDVVYEVAIAAASTGKGFDGPLLAELLEGSGPIEDVRLSLAIGVLRLGSKLTGDKMLAVLESFGFAGEAAAARIARDELAKVPDVVVEAVTALPAPVETRGEGA